MDTPALLRESGEGDKDQYVGTKKGLSHDSPFFVSGYSDIYAF